MRCALHFLRNFHLVIFAHQNPFNSFGGSDSTIVWGEGRSRAAVMSCFLYVLRGFYYNECQRSWVKKKELMEVVNYVNFH